MAVTELRFEEARRTDLIIKCSRFRLGHKSWLRGQNKYGNKINTHERRLRGTKRAEREVFVYDGNLLLGRIFYIDPAKVKTAVYNRTGEGPWAIEYNGESGFCNEEYAKHFCKTFLDAKRESAAYFKNKQQKRNERQRENPRSTVPLTALPFGTADEFYPTPEALAGRMLGKIDWRSVSTILEPSAGKGDLLAAVRKNASAYDSPIHELFGNNAKNRVDCIEIDQNLQALLRGMGYKVVADDFLSFDSYKKYDLILMNPPFSNGDAHLLKAIALQERWGGQICCLLNANTIKNPCTRQRQALIDKLKQYGARFDFVKHGFSKAERKSDVETVIVWLDVPRKESRSRIVEFLKKAPKYNGDLSPTALMEKSDWVHELIQLFNFEADAIVHLLREYEGIRPYLEPSGYDSALITLCFDGKGSGTTRVDTNTINSVLEGLRERFWRKLLHDERLEELIGKMTEAIRRDYDGKIHEMRDRDFTEYNIRAVILDIQDQLVQGLEDEIMRQFGEMTSHAMYDGCKNVHYYTGWKTNNAAKLGMKVILPCYTAFGSYSWNQKDTLDEDNVRKELSDLLKVLDFLDRGQVTYHPNLASEISKANIGKKRRTIDTAYFQATFYKKGTLHIKFHEDARHVVDRLNIFAATHQKNGANWLPPYFGKVAYSDMDEEGKAIIDSFYGDIENEQERQAEYAKVCKDPGYYLTTIDSTSIPL